MGIFNKFVIPIPIPVPTGPGIGSKSGTGSRAETRSSAGIDSNRRRVLIQWQRKYLNRFCSQVSLKSSYFRQFFEILLRKMADLSLSALDSALEPIPCIESIPLLELIPAMEPIPLWNRFQDLLEPELESQIC